MDQLQAMRIFVKVADQGSMAGAARALDLSPAVVTRQLAQLENHLGTRLMQRNSRRLSLTEAGQEYRRRAGAILAKVDEATEAVTRQRLRVEGRLRLSAPSVLLAQAVSPLLPGLRQRHPDVQLSVEATPEAGPGLVQFDHRSDITLMAVPLGRLQGDFVARMLAHAELLLCASPAYLRAHGVPAHPSDLNEADWIIPRSVQAMQDAELATLSTRDGSETFTLKHLIHQPSLDTEHRETLQDAVRAGLGIGPILSYAAMNDLMAGRLVRLLPNWQARRWGIYAVTASRLHQPARVRAALAYFTEHLGGQAHDPWLTRIENVRPPALPAMDRT